MSIWNRSSVSLSRAFSVTKAIALSASPFQSAVAIFFAVSNSEPIRARFSSRSFFAFSRAAWAFSLSSFECSSSFSPSSASTIFSAWL